MTEANSHEGYHNVVKLKPFVPLYIFDWLSSPDFAEDEDQNKAHIKELTGVGMFADISGFSTLADQLDKDARAKENKSTLRGRDVTHIRNKDDDSITASVASAERKGSIFGSALFSKAKQRKNSVFHQLYRNVAGRQTPSPTNKMELGASTRLSVKMRPKVRSRTSSASNKSDKKINMLVRQDSSLSIVRKEFGISSSSLARDTQVKHAREIGSHDAAAELSEVLDKVLTKMITLIVECGGDVVTFCGDALLAIFPLLGTLEGDQEEMWKLTVISAVMCGVDMLRVPQSTGFEHKLGIHVGMGCSRRIRAVNVGGSSGKRWQTFVTGSILNQMFDAEAMSKKGELVISSTLYNEMSKACSEMKGTYADAVPRSSNGSQLISSFSCDSNTRARIKGYLEKTNRVLAESIDLLGRPYKALMGYVPAPYLVSRTGGASVRNVTCLFIRLVDAPSMHDDDDIDSPEISSTLEVYQTFTSAVQEAISRHRGVLRQVVFDDKGLVAIGIVGVPPHGDSEKTERGLQIGIDVQNGLRAKDTCANIGISSGPAFCGVVGNEMRCDYTVIGDTVNLAARLMGKCESLGATILCDLSTSKGARIEHGIKCVSLAKISVKGKEKEIEVFKVKAYESRSFKEAGRGNRGMGFVGRTQQTSKFMNWFKYGIEDVVQSRICLILGDRGCGKSRLLDHLYEMVAKYTMQMDTKMFHLYYSRGHCTGAGSESYHVWVPVILHVLENTKDAARRRRESLTKEQSDIKFAEKYRRGSRVQVLAQEDASQNGNVQQKPELAKRLTDTSLNSYTVDDDTKARVGSEKHHSAGELSMLSTKSFGRVSDSFNCVEDVMKHPVIKSMIKHATATRTLVLHLCRILSLPLNDMEKEHLQSVVVDDVHVNRFLISLICSNAAEHTILFFDDMQWFDAHSILLMQYICQHGRRIHIVTTNRTSLQFLQKPHSVSSKNLLHSIQTADSAQELRKNKIISEMERVAGLCISLGKMSQIELGLLLSSHFASNFEPKVITSIHERAIGNPLDSINMAEEMLNVGILKADATGSIIFSDETSSLAMDLLPENMQALIMAKYNRLTLKQQKVLWVMSVIGMMCPLSTLLLLGANALELEWPDVKSAELVRKCIIELIHHKFLKEKCDLHVLDGGSSESKSFSRIDAVSEINSKNMDDLFNSDFESVVSPPSIKRAKTERLPGRRATDTSKGEKPRRATDTKRLTATSLQKKRKTVEFASGPRKSNPFPTRESDRVASQASVIANKDDSILEFVSVDTLDIVYNAILPSERKRMHALCFDVLKTTQASLNGELHDTLGHHAFRAGRYIVAIECYEEAKTIAYDTTDYYHAADCLRSCISIGREHLDEINEFQIPFWLLELGICTYITDGADGVDIKSLAESLYRFKKIRMKIETRSGISKWAMRWIRFKALLTVSLRIKFLEIVPMHGVRMSAEHVMSGKKGRRRSTMPKVNDKITSKSLYQVNKDRYSNACLGHRQVRQIMRLIISERRTSRKLYEAAERKVQKLQRYNILRALDVNIPLAQVFHPSVGVGKNDATRKPEVAAMEAKGKTSKPFKKAAVVPLGK